MKRDSGMPVATCFAGAGLSARFARRVLSQAVCIVNIAAGGAAVCGVKQGE